MSKIVDQICSDAVPFAFATHSKQSISNQVKVIVKVQISGHRIQQIDGYSGTTVNMVSLSFKQAPLRTKIGEYGNQVVPYIRVDLQKERKSKDKNKNKNVTLGQSIFNSIRALLNKIWIHNHKLCPRFKIIATTQTIATAAAVETNKIFINLLKIRRK